jgi:SH3 domain-containing YSC84-like protein 1
VAPIRSAAAALAMAASVAATGAAAQTTTPQTLIDRAWTTVEHLKANPEFSNFNDLLHQAQAVVVVPRLIKAGFVIGGAGGSGVLLARGPQGEWSYPAFLRLGAGSIGFQFGAEMSEVVLVIMNRRALDKLLQDRVTLGADASVAAGAMGGSLQAGTTTNAGADIYTFASSKGLFGGLALEGGVLTPDQDDDRAYYGTDATTRDIVIDRRFKNPSADPLRNALPVAWPLPLPTAQPAGPAPATSAPAQSTPVESAPVPNAPVQNGPVERAPIESAPLPSPPTGTSSTGTSSTGTSSTGTSSTGTGQP